jgi:hypothetical protein
VEGSYPQKTAVLATIDTGQIITCGTEVVLVDRAGTRSWRHECGARPRAAHVSADRVLVTTDKLAKDYDAWGLLGPALLLDLGTGERVAELRGSRGAALDGGRFLLGLEGYDIFDTWLHDSHGKLLTSWHTYGHYVVGADGIRVLECDRKQPTGSTAARLLPDGGIERGHRLRDSQVPEPIVLPDGTIVVLDCGVLLAVDPDLRGRKLATTLNLSTEDLHRFSATLDLAEDGVLTVTITEWSRSPDRSAETHWVRYALHT